MWLGLRGGHEAWNEKKPKIRGSTGGASSVQGRKETVAQTDSGRSSAHRRLYLPACARHQFQLCPARLGGLWSSLLSWTPPSEHLWLSGVALDSPNIKLFLQEDRCRMPFFLLFLACLMSALVVRSSCHVIQLESIHIELSPRFLSVCHMWSCKQAGGEEEDEEQMLSKEEQQVPIKSTLQGCRQSWAFRSNRVNTFDHKWKHFVTFTH